MFTKAPFVAVLTSAIAFVSAPAQAGDVKIFYQDGVAVKVLPSPDAPSTSHTKRSDRHDHFAQRNHAKTVTKHSPRRQDRFRSHNGRSFGHALPQPSPQYRVNPKFSAGKFSRGFNRSFGHSNFRNDRIRGGHSRNFVRPGFRSHFNNRGFSRGFHRGNRFGHVRSRGRH